MAKLKINGNVKIGGIYECHFGSYKHKTIAGQTTNDPVEASVNDYNYPIPLEIIKKRAVVVIAKDRGLCTVVPISSTKEKFTKPSKDPVAKGIHILLGNDFPTTHHYQTKDRWAKSNLVRTIDSSRLTDIYCSNHGGFIQTHQISEEILRKIRYGVIIHIGLRDLVTEPDLSIGLTE
jgi:uncharacterized protein YifN (PemK superfamily)